MSRVHVVEQGECLGAIAFRYGFASGRAIYDAPENADLRELRPDPNSLLPGDRVVIPERRRREESASSGSRATFRRKRPTKPLNLVLQGADPDRFANRDYRLEIVPPGSAQGEPIVFEGRLDGDGRLEENVPIAADRGTLTVGLEDGECQLHLYIDHLDPADEPTGIQGRLHNLGFDPGRIDGKTGPRTREALRAFQAQQELSITGEADQETIDALRREHRS